MAKSSNLHKAKTAKNDEFYTQLADIEKELKHYKAHFKGKTIFCNCDNPKHSNFWKYFHLNFKHFGLKKLIATHYHETEPTYKIEYTGEDDNNCEIGVITNLKTNGDFRSHECIALLQEADIIVTNPPFSLFREYVAQLIDYDKKFICIGSINAIAYKVLFPLLKNNKVWLGCTSPKEFIQPNKSIKKFGNITWFTNLDIIKRREFLDLIEKYTPEKYPKYDNYDAINVNKVLDIPVDYNGVMGVPITFMDKYNPKQFEILGLAGMEYFDEISYPIKHYENAIQHNKDGSVVKGNADNAGAMLLVDDVTGTYYTADNSDGKLVAVYARILIRKKID